MTEKQIIKAWEDVIKYEFVPNERFIDETLELIRCKNAEIERLQKEKDFEQYEKTRLRLLFKGEYDNNKKVKSEAIKEFAERLKEEATVDDDSTWWVANIDIDNLVKEMTEGKE